MKRSMVQRAGKGLAALLLTVAVSTGVLPASAEAAETPVLADFEGMFDTYTTNRNIWDDFFNWPEPVAADDFTE